MKRITAIIRTPVREMVASDPTMSRAAASHQRLDRVRRARYTASGTSIVNTAPLSLDAIIDEIATAHAAGKDVARLHSGDLSVWSAMGEQLRRLRELGIPFTVTPGVPSFAAAAAALEAELTLPGLAQSVVLTRTSGRASAMPEGETLAAFAATGAVLAIHLSVHVLDKVIAELTPHYGSDCPVAVVCTGMDKVRGNVSTWPIASPTSWLQNATTGIPPPTYPRSSFVGTGAPNGFS